MIAVAPVTAGAVQFTVRLRVPDVTAPLSGNSGWPGMSPCP